ncbi:MAG: hypothetical protein R6T92_14545, partial [Desulfosalsimonadaceae bacterium]
EVNLFDHASFVLNDKIAIFISGYGAVKIVNDFLVPEFAVFVPPAALSVQVENRFFPGDDDFTRFLGHWMSRAVMVLEYAILEKMNPDTYTEKQKQVK